MLRPLISSPRHHRSFVFLNSNDLCGDPPKLHISHVYYEDNPRLHKPCSTPPAPSPAEVAAAASAAAKEAAAAAQADYDAHWHWPKNENVDSKGNPVMGTEWEAGGVSASEYLFLAFVCGMGVAFALHRCYLGRSTISFAYGPVLVGEYSDEDEEQEERDRAIELAPVRDSSLL